MNRKKELKQLYKETPIEGGVFQVKNTRNGKIFVDSTRNFKTINGVKFSLETGGYINKELQADWNLFGKDTFTFDILEKLKPNDDDPYYNEKEALALLEEKWLEQLQPYGERGYNR